MVVRLNPAVRLIPPSEVSGEQWVAENLLERKRYRISPAAAAALVAANRPQKQQDLAKRLMEISDNESGDSWERLIVSLCDRGLIVQAASIRDDPQLAWLVALRRNWSRFGWHEAAEYHLLSYDYPCIDYSEAVAFLTDQARMREYQTTEPDADRYKLDYVDRPATTLPEPTVQLPTAGADAAWSGTVTPVAVDASTLSTVLSLTFGQTGTLVPRTDSAPLLRRTSPSGGGRHPSEGYLAVLDVPGLDNGWHHVTMKPFSLRRLDLPPPDDVLGELFPETVERFPFPARALLVVTSVFERNMYRYREPRTFRTVHMDAGHLAGTAWIAARSCGLTAGIYYCDHAPRIEAALGLDGMEEGYMLTVAIADGVTTGRPS
ncbi:SagB/ThcOx family dehydrogenase [Plantactinospora sp. B24E8]|uniref:SagB/ThcOx family dehydrogenase n=1 Tax=Plantactinospora sp. B24E8 TaxID=3153567 RepID=UPI00325EEA8C